MIPPGQIAVDHRAESILLGTKLLAQHRVQIVQHLHGIIVGYRRGTQGVPGQSGYYSGVHPFARDIAEKEAPPCAGQREEVVRVTAHVVVRRGEVEVGCVQPGGR
jgi:hypothetical protein